MPETALFGKLKPGPAQSPEAVVKSQRMRLYGAAVELVSHRGHRKATVRALARLAGVSTGTFYTHFANVEECLAFTYEALMRQAIRRAAAQRDQHDDWEAGFRAGLLELMENLASNPSAARFLLIDVFDAGPVAQERIREMTAEFERLLTTSLNAAPKRFLAPRHLVVGVVAGAMRVARTTTITERTAELPSLARPLGDWILTLSEGDLLSLRGDLPPRRPPVPTPEDGHRPEDERGRLLTAAAKLALTHGYHELTVTKIRTEAGVSRRTFDALFPGVKECFLSAVEDLVTQAIASAAARAASASTWQGRVYTTTLSLCDQMACDPALARLALVDILHPGSLGLLQREQLITTISTHIRNLITSSLRPTQLTTEASLTAAWQIAHADVVAGRTAELPQVAPLLSYTLFAPVLSPQTAIEALRRSPRRYLDHPPVH